MQADFTQTNKTNKKSFMIPIIQKTKDYSKFKFLNGNRELNNHKLNSLIFAIQTRDKLYINPMIVDKNFRVLDGQHRLRAAEKLNKEIYYIVDEFAEDSDMITLNKERSNWKPIDYIKFYANSGNENYIKFLELCDISLSIMYSPAKVFDPYFCFFPMGNNSLKIEYIQSGKIVIDFEKIEDFKLFFTKLGIFVKNLLTKIREFNKTVSKTFLYKREYLESFTRFYLIFPEKFDRLTDCLMRDFDKIPNLGAAVDVRKFIENCYNSGLKKDKIEFSI